MALDKVKDDMLQDNLVFPGSTTQFPSITTTQRNALSGVQPGTMIYNSTVGKLQQYDGNNAWATVDSPPVITSITYPTENGITATALEASGTTNVSETLIINGSNFSSASEIQVQIQVSGSYVAFASSIAVNSGRNQITCTGVTKRAAADDYTLKVTNVTGLAATTTVNFSADPAFSTAASLGTVFTGATLNKTIAFTGTKVTQGATTKPTWMTVTGNTSTADNGASDTTFDATGSPITLGGTTTNTDGTNNYTFSIIVRDAENQTFNRDFSLTVTDPSTGGAFAFTSGDYRVHTFTSSGNFMNYAAITNAEIMIVGGGGTGGWQSGGGGGGGQILYKTGVTIPAGTGSGHAVVVGAGGEVSGTTWNASALDDGSPSSFTFGGTTYTAKGGGHGGPYDNDPSAKSREGSIGSGGGGGGTSVTNYEDGATAGGNTYDGWTSYSNDGGNGWAGSGGHAHAAGGGGGAGAAGTDTSASENGDGGAGKVVASWMTKRALTNNNSHDNSTALYFAAGGGGCVHIGAGGNGGLGGGGGGASNVGGGTGSAGTGGGSAYNTGSNGEATANPNGGDAGANTGSGGGGAGNGQNSKVGGDGGSGIVVIRYQLT